MTPVIHDKPPNFAAICAAFPAAKTTKGILFTYGPAVYNPDGVIISPWLREHEATHVEQQREMGPETWWRRYIAEPAFRLEQELEAVLVEYRVYCETDPKPNRTARFGFLDGIAYRLSGHLYGYMIRKPAVKKILKQRT